MRFHLDEHIPGALAAALRMHGHDVTTAADSQLLHADDQLHIEHALREGRILITHDRDYLSLNASGVAHAGIAYCHQQKYSVGQLLMMCLLLDECYTQEEMHQRIEYL
jgi:predicted nuclease of predicted toxin-antitoxin system